MCIPNNEIVEVLLVKHFAIRLNHFQAGIFHSRPRDQRTSLDVVLFAGGAWINGRLATQFQHYIWHTNYMGLHLFSFGCTGSHYHKVYSFIVSVLWLLLHLGQKKTKYIIIIYYRPDNTPNDTPQLNLALNLIGIYRNMPRRRRWTSN